MVAALDGSLEEALTNGTVLQISLFRLLRGVLERDDPLAGETHLCSGFGASGDIGIGQTSQVRLIVNHQRGGVCVCEDPVSKLVGELRLFLVQGAHSVFVSVGEQRTGANEIA